MQLLGIASSGVRKLKVSFPGYPRCSDRILARFQMGKCFNNYQLFAEGEVNIVE